MSEVSLSINAYSRIPSEFSDAGSSEFITSSALIASAVLKTESLTQFTNCLYSEFVISVSSM